LITLKVVPDNGETYTVTATSRDIVTWERTHKGAKFANLESATMADLYALAYFAAVRKGLFSGAEKEFSDSVDIEPVADEDSTPTKRGR
jgi:hypothetical protein